MKIENVFSKPAASLSVFSIDFVFWKMIDKMPLLHIFLFIYII